MTEVVDIHMKNGERPDFDVYIGRLVRNTEFNFGSKWHNPFRLNSHNIKDSLKSYEKYIRKQMKINPVYFNLNEIKGKKLGCWCITTDKLEPLVCHGQILMKLLKEKCINDNINSK